MLPLYVGSSTLVPEAPGCVRGMRKQAASLQALTYQGILATAAPDLRQDERGRGGGFVLGRVKDAESKRHQRPAAESSIRDLQHFFKTKLAEIDTRKRLNAHGICDGQHAAQAGDEAPEVRARGKQHPRAEGSAEHGRCLRGEPREEAGHRRGGQCFQ